MRRFFGRLGFDGLLSLVFVLGAVIAYAEASTFPGIAGVWPRWVLGTFGLLSALVPVGKFLAPPHPRTEERR